MRSPGKYIGLALLVVGSFAVVSRPGIAPVQGPAIETPSPTPSPTALQTPNSPVVPLNQPAVPPTASHSPSAAGKAAKSVLSDYKGIWLGITANDLRRKLGSPQDKGDDQDFYVFSDNESAQFFYDNDHKVKAIAITYSGDLRSALTSTQVFGKDVPLNSEGGIFNLVRYPEASYWVSYNRTSGENAIISIAVQKF